MRGIKKNFEKLKNSGIIHTIKIVCSAFARKTYQFLEKLILKMPLQNTIVFECESDMDDNPRAVYEYMISQKMNCKYRIVWLVRNVEYCKREYRQKNVKFINRFDQKRSVKLKLHYYLSTAKWFVFSHPYWFHKKKEAQLVVFTGHGNPIKHGGNSDVAVRSVDAMLVTSEGIRHLSAKGWNCPDEKIFVCGYPRNDFLVQGDRNEILPRLFRWNRGEKVIMCMPTYKKSAVQTDSAEDLDRFAMCVVQTEAEFRELDDYLRENHIHLIIKLHPLQVLDEMKLASTNHIHYLQNNDLLEKKILLYELLGCCDALVTDFSSVFYDFLVLDRPVAFFLKNYDSYTRGFVMINPLDYMPGDKLYTFFDFKQFIDNVVNNVDNYAEHRKKIDELVNGFEAGTNSERFIDMMLSGEIRDILRANAGEKH